MVTGEAASHAKRAATVAGYQVAYEIVKAMLPLCHSELYDCMTKVAPALYFQTNSQFI